MGTESKATKAAGYSAAKGARAAARKVLGAEAVEGAEFKVTEIDGGRFDWEAIEQPKRKGRVSGKGKLAAPKAEGQLADSKPAKGTAFPEPQTRQAADITDTSLVDSLAVGYGPIAAVEGAPEPLVVNTGASAFAAFAMQQLTAVDSTATSRSQKPTEPKPPKAQRPAPEIVNGVRKPSVGTVCRAVWDELDKMVEANNTPDSKKVKALAESLNWNTNNASIEYYQWRKFHGIKGRAAKPAAALPVAA